MACKTTKIPKIWKKLEEEGRKVGLDNLLNIWENRLRHSDTTNELKPRTIIGVTGMKMMNLIPQDVAHPLYHSSYFDLTDAFITDSLCMTKLDVADAALETENGISLKAMSEKDLTFKLNKDSKKITVNGINVEKTNTLSDGTVVIILEGFLFSHYDDVQAAFRKLMKEDKGACHGCQ